MIEQKHRADSIIASLADAIERNDDAAAKREVVALAQIAFGAYLSIADSLQRLASPVVSGSPLLDLGAIATDRGD